MKHLASLAYDAVANFEFFMIWYGLPVGALVLGSGIGLTYLLRSHKPLLIALLMILVLGNAFAFCRVFNTQACLYNYIMCGRFVAD